MKRPYSAGWNSICITQVLLDSVATVDDIHLIENYHFDWALGMGFLIYNILISNQTGHSPLDWSQVGADWATTCYMLHLCLIWYVWLAYHFFQPGNKSSFDNSYCRRYTSFVGLLNIGLSPSRSFCQKIWFDVWLATIVISHENTIFCHTPGRVPLLIDNNGTTQTPPP